jgi:methyl-accepting chemotaxis protein
LTFPLKNVWDETNLPGTGAFTSALRLIFRPAFMNSSSSLSRRIAFSTGLVTVTALTVAVVTLSLLPATASDAARSVLLFGLLLITATGAASYWIINRAVVAPIREISERAACLSRNCIAGIERIADGMAAGDLTGTLEATTTLLGIRSGDELGTLAETINGIIRTC